MEFDKLEEEFQNPKSTSGGGGGILSRAPPPNREEELRSHAKYYHPYTREYFTQESDCLDIDPLMARDIKRYLYYLRKGEKDRKWLLGDMMFADPYKDAVDQGRMNKFEVMSKRYLGVDVEDNDESSKAKNGPPQQQQPLNNGFEEDEDPEWFQEKYPHL